MNLDIANLPEQLGKAASVSWEGILERAGDDLAGRLVAGLSGDAAGQLAEGEESSSMCRTLGAVLQPFRGWPVPTETRPVAGAACQRNP